MIYRGTFAEINLDNYFHNLEYISKESKTKVMPVIKGDAYGHGSVILAKEAEKKGYDYFAVAFLQEAVELLKNGVKAKILIFNFFLPEHIEIVYDNRNQLIPTISSVEMLKQFIEVLGRRIRNIKFHINFNTGIARNCIMENEMEELINLIKEYNLYIEGVYTHFASADDDDEYVKKQMALFKQKLYYLSENNINYDMVHYSNSAAALLQKIDLKTDYVRAGIASYGLQPSNIKKSEGLKPVLSVKSVLAKTFLLKEGETVGYGRTYKCDKETTCGIVPLGYADGYFRAFSNKAYVLVKGKKCSVIGRVSMDQLVIDITNSGAKFLDEVVLLGKQGNENISCEYLAELANTINYEITSLISKRVKRIYVKGDEVYEGRVCIEGCYSENYFSRTTR